MAGRAKNLLGFLEQWAFSPQIHILTPLVWFYQTFGRGDKYTVDLNDFSIDGAVYIVAGPSSAKQGASWMGMLKQSG